LKTPSLQREGNLQGQHEDIAKGTRIYRGTKRKGSNREQEEKEGKEGWRREEVELDLLFPINSPMRQTPKPLSLSLHYTNQ